MFVGTFEVVCFITKATGQYPSKKLGKGGSPSPSLFIVTASSPNECRFGVKSVTVKGVKVQSECNQFVKGSFVRVCKRY